MYRIIRFTLTVMLVFGSSLLALAQDSGSTMKTLYVGPELVPCEGDTAQRCLQVKENPDDAYTLFSGSIEDFEYDPGFEYELQVDASEVENPPADGSASYYTLIEIVSQTRVLQGNIWVLSQYRGTDGEMVDTLPDQQVTAEFDGENLSGSAGCNSYSGPYTVDGSTMTLGPMISTMMACAQQSVMDQEAAFTGQLDQVVSYDIVDDQLQLSNADGEVILSFHVMGPLPLVGTAWVLNSAMVGQDGAAIVSEAQITASFDTSATMSGSSGCNSYTSPYAASDGLMTIGPVVSTRMACAQPDGVMAQESAYLNALDEAAYYEIYGDTLDLLDSESKLLLSYTGQQS